MNRFKRFHKGWNKKVYYIEMDKAEIQERERFKLFLGVIIGMPVMAILCMLAAGVF